MDVDDDDDDAVTSALNITLTLTWMMIIHVAMFITSVYLLTCDPDP